MRSVEEVIAARLISSCLAVAPAGPAVCQTCRAGTTARSPTCATCRDVGRQLGHPLVPVTPISLVTKDNSLYRALRQYKSGEPSVARNQARSLGALLALFLRRHLACVTPGGIDTVLVVPSEEPNRPPPHPLLRVLDSVGDLPPASPLLRAAPGTLGHRAATPTGYVCEEPVEGRRVLLMDDTYTTGAHLQSAAHALAAGGALTVHPLVIGRYIQPNWPASQSVIAWANRHRWVAETCTHCAPG
ncbi:MAG: hypothetical protein ACRDYZ_14735 [Acidimicrobiales bacterium]